jgi:glycyl-tRNA synthetase
MRLGIGRIFYEDTGNIGKGYRRHDEVGTPLCVTVDFQTIEEDDTVTIRNRDTMAQERIKVSDLANYVNQFMRS